MFINIPKEFYHRELVLKLEDLIDEGYKNYHDLDDLDKDHLTTIAISLMGEDAYTCIVESDLINKTITNLSKFIKNSNLENAIDLADILKSSAKAHYQPILNELFEELLTHRVSESFINSGLRAFKDRINGEVVWR